MKNKRITERFPFLLPIRKFQRKIFFYIHMKMDSNKYSRKIGKELLEYKVFLGKSKLINSESGYDIKYQINKVDNLKLVAKILNKVIIEPDEIFSFWMLSKKAKKYGKYKEGLVMVDNHIVLLRGG